MQVIIPMAGIGRRFQEAGYTVPKMLIEIEGKRVLQHIIEMFPGETDFLLIVNETDQALYQKAFLECAPTAVICVVPHHKKGPVWSVLLAESYIREQEPVVVNYCDFSCVWDWENFKKFVRKEDLDGCIPAYRGFHPHSVYSNYYAYLKMEEGWVTAIQEKQPFTEKPMEEFASSGTYYFRSGRMVKKYFRETVEKKLQVQGEYYVSLVYSLMIQHNLKVFPYEIQYFMQWGTPQDLAEYCYWSDAFKKLRSSDFEAETYSGTLIMLMAGLGVRFQREGYALPKSMIPVGNVPMVIQASKSLPKMAQKIFVLRKSHQEYFPIIQNHFPEAEVEILEQVTEGQACSCLTALDRIHPDSPLLISACDAGLKYSPSRFRQLVDDLTVDLIVFGAKGYPGSLRSPESYGWIGADCSGRIERVSVKKPISQKGVIEKDPVIVGTFWFRKASQFKLAVQKMIRENDRVNSEFYIDSAINHAIELGYRAAILEVDHYLCWGTPNEYRTFEYWRKCFQGFESPSNSEIRSL